MSYRSTASFGKR